MSVARRLRLGAVIASIGFFSALSGARALDLYADNIPQAQTDTCQSYSIVWALAAKGDPAFAFDTFADIRKGEADFRSIAASIPGGPFGHDALKAAVANYTSNIYRLEVESINGGIVAWLQRAKSLTRLEATGDALIGKLTGSKFPTVLTSVTKLDNSPYSGGHIVTVLGVIGSGLNSATQISVFNSAIKGQDGSVSRCEASTQPGDMRYKAGVLTTNDFALKPFPGYLLMHLEKN